MDNAVKALYIAASSLLALMILGVFVYMFRQGARLERTYDYSQSTLQVIKFNSQFEPYTKITLKDSDGTFITKGNTASDIVTCANLAMNINEKNDFDERNSVTVIICIGGDTYSIYPLENQPKKAFIKNKSFSMAKNSSSFDIYEFDSFLKKYNEAEFGIDADGHLTEEMIYKYYFDVNGDENGNNIDGAGGIHYSEITR